MSAAEPASCCLATTGRAQPVHLWDALTGAGGLHVTVCIVLLEPLIRRQLGASGCAAAAATPGLGA